MAPVEWSDVSISKSISHRVDINRGWNSFLSNTKFERMTNTKKRDIAGKWTTLDLQHKLKFSQSSLSKVRIGYTLVARTSVPGENGFREKWETITFVGEGENLWKVRRAKGKALWVRALTT